MGWRSGHRGLPNILWVPFRAPRRIFHAGSHGPSTKDGKIVANFNVGGDSFHLDNSSINSRTLNQPVDMNFPIGNDPGEYDLQLIRSKSSGVATGIAEFWGYLTTDSCQLR
jgi:hypothetical protein